MQKKAKTKTDKKINIVQQQLNYSDKDPFSPNYSKKSDTQK